MAARDDPVADLASFGPDPSRMDGMKNLSTAAAETPIGPTIEITGHTDYLAENSTSQYNIATVIAGVPARGVPGQQRGVGDWLAWMFVQP